MSRKHSGFPVGAKWIAVAKNGSKAWYWLDERRQVQGRPYDFFEVWKWDICYSDGSRPWTSGDWGRSRSSVRNEVDYRKLSVYADQQGWSRFKRVKESKDVKISRRKAQESSRQLPVEGVGAIPTLRSDLKRN